MHYVEGSGEEGVAVVRLVPVIEERLHILSLIRLITVKLESGSSTLGKKLASHTIPV